MARALALDLGTKTCGFAISDADQIFSFPLDNFHFPENQFKKVLEKIDALLQEYEISVLVLGYPTRMTGTKSERTFMVEDFYEILKQRYSINVVLVDERLTTKAANSILKQGGLSAKKRKQHKDKLAAQIILESYLFKGV
ncbi:Holliday junction resolvase RuvX [Candidatus Mycoplasma pogonae]